MINFRYHVVSLVAVFLALAVGVVLGASVLGRGLNHQVLQQAQADRKQLSELRQQQLAEKQLNHYRDAYDEQVGVKLTTGRLAGQQVAILVMPGGPNQVVKNVSAAVKTAGGKVTTTVNLTSDAFTADHRGDLTAALNQFAGQVDVPPDQPVATRLGATLGRALLAPQQQPADKVSTTILTTLQKGGFVNASSTDADRTTLLVVVTAPSDASAPTSTKAIEGHVQLDEALAQRSIGTVVAGPDSTGITGTDVAGIRSSSAAARAMSSVDVADLPSGVTTVVLALVEELHGGHGHYGAASSSDAPAPKLTP